MQISQTETVNQNAFLLPQENLTVPQRDDPVRVLLVYVNKFSPPVLPLGVNALKSYLNKHYNNECEVAIKDVQLDSITEIADFSKNFAPDIIGISACMTHEKLLKDVVYSISDQVESKPLLAIGKDLSILFSEEVLKQFPYGVAATGEGELTIGGLVEYCQGKRNLTEVPNISFLREGSPWKSPSKQLTDLSQMGIGDRENYEYYFNNSGSIRIEDSRSCPWGKCTFCMTQQYFGSSWRPRPMEDILSELEMISSIGTQNIIFTGEEFFGSSMAGFQRALEMANGMIERDIENPFFINSRMDSLFKTSHTAEENKLVQETLEHLGAAGLQVLFIGLESAAVSQSKRYNKGIKLEQFAEGMEFIKPICEQAGITVSLGVIMIEPLLTKEELRENLLFIQDNELEKYLSKPLNDLKLYPNSSYLKLLRKKEAETGKQLLSDTPCLDSRGYEVVDFVNEDVSLIFKGLKEYQDIDHGMNLILRNLTKYFISGPSEADPVLVDTYEQLKQMELDFLLELSELSEYDLMSDSIRDSVVFTAKNKMLSLAGRLYTHMELNNLITARPYLELSTILETILTEAEFTT